MSPQKQSNREASPGVSRLPAVKTTFKTSDPKEVKQLTSRRPLGHFRTTAYTRDTRSSGRTASGTRPSHERTVAVDPRIIPLGTKIEIEGIGVRIAEDTGGHVKVKKLDLYLPSVPDVRTLFSSC